MSWVHNKTEYQTTGSKGGEGNSSRTIAINNEYLTKTYYAWQRKQREKGKYVTISITIKLKCKPNCAESEQEGDAKDEPKRMHQECHGTKGMRAICDNLKMPFRTKNVTTLWDINERLQGRRLTEDLNLKSSDLKL